MSTPSRLARGHLLVTRDGSLQALAPGLYRVASSTGRGFYGVRLDGVRWTCECPDFSGRQLSCKHIAAVVEHLTLAAGIEWPGPRPESALPRPSYPQDWPAYDAGQQAEHPMFDALLWDLLTDIPEPERSVGTRGRPPIPLRTQLFCAIKKVQSQESGRRARGLLLATQAVGKGLLPRVPSYNTPSRFFRDARASALLGELLHGSAAPLRPLEDQGTVAVDSSGFCTTCRGAWCSERYQPGRTHSWVKVHVVVGTKTHIVLEARVTGENGADSPLFLPMLRTVKEEGTSPARATADKAYLSRENLEGAAELGMDPYVPFRSNSTPRRGGSRLWREKYLQFQLHREEFDRKYHLRSNGEAAFSAIKRKLGESLLSKDPVARVNELLAKLVAYNIGVVTHEAYEHRIDTGVTLPDLQMPIAGRRWEPDWDKMGPGWDKNPPTNQLETDAEEDSSSGVDP
jgi:transposase